MTIAIVVVVALVIGFWLSRLSRGMLFFILRRVVAGLIVVLVSSAIVYWLMSKAGDPLLFAQEEQDPVRRAQVERYIIGALDLDLSLPRRYWNWLSSAVRGDFGSSVQSDAFSINADLRSRIPITLKLVSVAALVSIVVGVAVGVVSAIRQYSGFDYLVSFFTFLFFSVPVFWVAVILKQYGGIDFNDWLRANASFSAAAFVAVGILAFLIVFTSAGGTLARKLIVACGTVAVIELLMLYVSAKKWMRNPGLGPIGVAVAAIAIALLVTAVMAGLRNVKARNAAFTIAAIGIVGWFPVQALFNSSLFDTVGRSLLVIIGLAVVAVAVGILVGRAWGGFDTAVSSRVAALTAFFVGMVLLVDRTMRSWSEYSELSLIRNRPIKTQYDREARLDGDFWLEMVDTFTHLILPTIALMLISLARYTRYTRGSMLEVLNQDYIRTARSKGLTERTVVVRHALRNSLIPLATIIPFDISQVIGGAVITETVFGWEGMGQMFIEGLQGLDPNRVMGFFVVVAVMAVIGNLLADLMYATLDPRIRLGS